MSDEKINTPPNPEDTKTRKTIRLKPLIPKVPVVNPAPSAPVPAASDTRTRKTIRLKPLMPKVPVVNPAPETPAVVTPAPVMPAPAAPAASEVSTATQKTVKMKRTAPAAQELSTATQKTVKIKRTDVPGAPAAEVSTETQKTVKIKRSPLPEAITPLFDSTKTQDAIKMSKEAPTVIPASISIDDDRTVKIKRPAINPQASLPTVKIAPQPAVPTPKIAPIKAKPAAVAETKIPKVSLDMVSPKIESDEAPSRLHLALTILTFLALLVAATVTSVHYLDIQHNIQLGQYIPGLSSAK